MESLSELNGKRVLVIGGSSGLGGACVRSYLRHGARVGYTYLRGESALSDLRKLAPTQLIRWKLDLTRLSAMNHLVELLQQSLHPLDIVIMCQGMIVGKPLRDYTFSEIDRVFSVNALSVVRLTKMLEPVMANDASIVYISSISAFAGSYDAVYAASKGAVISFAKAMAKQLGPRVRVNAVAPGLTERTGMYDGMQEGTRRKHLESTYLKRLAQPEDIANTVLFLSTSSSRHITGSCIDVNGGEYVR